MAKATVTEKVTTTKTYHLELTEEEAEEVEDAVGARVRTAASTAVYKALHDARRRF